jgi:hypothetical protein
MLAFIQQTHLWSHHESEAKPGLISCIRCDQICKVNCCKFNKLLCYFCPTGAGLWVKDKRSVYTSDFALASEFL